MENTINVAHYVSELLFQHDCVIMPGFGGFVSTYSPARVHPAQHSFTPPSKQIVFNKHLQQNDGLLAQTISNAVPCSFDEAMLGITKFVEEINSKLKVGKKVELHNLGTLSIDPEKNISFETFPEINFLIDSFGLASFQSMPILHETVSEKRKPVERIDRPVAEELKVEKPSRNRTRKVFISTAIVIPVLVAALWFTSQKTDALAGFGLFGKKEVSKFQPVKWFSKGNNDTLRMITELKADSNGLAQISLADNAPPIIVDIHKVVPDSTMVVQTNLNLKSNYSGGRYYVVGGCFEVPENVERFIKTLKAKGYQPQVIDQVRSRLTHIGIASFNSKEEAVQYLSKVSTDVPGAWILKK
ncbi:MAG: SPOR domain-containing protein [Bacteroidetes bacterium]|nr:SPOR domain-containing protein [Bacteroidota bacterium]